MIGFWSSLAKTTHDTLLLLVENFLLAFALLASARLALGIFAEGAARRLPMPAFALITQAIASVFGFDFPSWM